MLMTTNWIRNVLSQSKTENIVKSKCDRKNCSTKCANSTEKWINDFDVTMQFIHLLADHKISRNHLHFNQSHALDK